MLGEKDPELRVTARRLSDLVTPLAAGLGVLLVSTAAAANGAFPAVSQLVSDPAEPAHQVLRSTFGLLATRDRGASWDWLCEAGLGYKDVQPPMAVLPGGVILLAVPDGISRGDASGCDFTLATGPDAAVLDLARVPAEPDGAVAVSLSGTTAQLWRTHDAGVTFAAAGEPISGFIPTTVDVSAPDPNVVYLSGMLGTQGALLRSNDGGLSFTSFPVPNTTTAHRPYIAALAPNDADVVYVRLDGEPSDLEVTRDGGETFTSPLTTEVPPLGLALSPDGRTVIASNSFDGTFRADTSTLAFEKVACQGPSCLSFTGSGLFGCGEQRVDGFIVGRSEDAGRSFQRVVDLTCIRGPAACGPDTSVGRLCPDEWPPVQAQIGATECSPPEVKPYTGCFDGIAGESGDEPTGGSSASGGATGSAGKPGRTGEAGAGRAGGGGGCGVAPSRGSRSNGWLLAGALGWLGWRRRPRARSR
jgi:hypothetical protein